MKRLISGAFILLGVMLPVNTTAESLTFSYIERPPYYFTSPSGAADGFLVTRTKKILQAAGIEAQFLSLTPNKINYILRYANVPHCSIGWFKKPERELFAKFTKPIYQNQPLVILTTKERKKHFKDAKTLAEIFTNRALTIARMGSFSYGTYVDQLLEKLSPKSRFYSKKQSSLLQALHANQASYMLIAPEEIEQIILTAKLPAEEFVKIPLEEIPHGNLRYLMCGHAVSDNLMAQLNSAIAKLYPTMD
ncbi:transporter substrate-binding domain-containing protein [uncultured Desulfuromusa sp.]|uniref:transporter substrate-binding domain-containing protein n=1 Tax=uncultured Desulfuromusa sp. TaxID=219183 RepID=UPI002AA75346|nr:transporter substrate-binding domain-containing protein [uncultured Desulfuromusa sp.]